MDRAEPREGGSLLNADIWLYIATFLPAFDLVHNLAPTCRFLYAIANDDSVWSSIEVYVENRHQLKYYAKKYPMIAHLRFSSWFSKPKEKTARFLNNFFAREFPSLQSVTGTTVTWALDHGRPLLAASTYNGALGSERGSLRKLKADGIGTGHIPLHALAEIAAHAPQLTALELRYYNRENFESVSSLFPSVTELSLHSVSASFEAWHGLVESHQHLRKLRLETFYLLSIMHERDNDDAPPLELPSASALSMPSGLTELNVYAEDRNWELSRQAHTWQFEEFIPRLVSANGATLTEFSVVAATELSVEAIVVALENCMVLTSFYMWTDPSSAPTQEAISQLATKIRLRECGGQFFDELVPALHGVSELKGEWANNSVVRHLGTSLSFLRVLEIRQYSDLSVESARSIGEHATLTELILRAEDDGSDGFSEALAPACTRLRRLTITYTGWIAVARAAAQGGQLQSFFCNISHPLALGEVLSSLPRGYVFGHLDFGYGDVDKSSLVEVLWEFAEKGGKIRSFGDFLEALFVYECSDLGACLRLSTPTSVRETLMSRET